jgi:hypothetical protein
MYLLLQKSTVKVIGEDGVIVPKHVVVGFNLELGQQLHNQKMVVRRVLRNKPKDVIHMHARLGGL